MKNYEEMARDLFARREEYERQQRIKKARTKKMVLCTASIGFVIIGGVSLWKFGELSQKTNYVQTAELEKNGDVNGNQEEQKVNKTEEESLRSVDGAIGNEKTEDSASLDKKEDTNSKEQKAVSDSAIGQTKEETDRKKSGKGIAPSDAKAEKEHQSNKKEIQAEFTIHEKNTHAIMGVNLPDGWDYCFVGSAHNSDGLKCCCALYQTETGSCVCNPSIVGEEVARICKNDDMGKGEQSEDKKLKEYGIQFWKAENPKMKFEYLYCKDRLLFCGTGVTIKEEKLKNMGTSIQALSYMEEMDKEIWYTLVFDRKNLITGDNGEYVLKCSTEKKLWNQYQNEIKKIMEGITLQKCR